ncbi:MAG TPA: peptidoglycan DD-metalloendopeptidase family protein [Candidatus Paceibacterota bacterium]
MKKRSEQSALFFRDRFFGLALMTVCVSSLFWGSPIVTAQTERAEELKQNISNSTGEIKKLEAEIADYKTRLDNVGTQKKTLQNAIETLDLTRAKLGKDADLTQIKIVKTNDTITELGKNISRKEDHIAQDKKAIRETIRQINEADANTLLEVLLSGNGISDFFMEIDDLGRLQASLRDNIKSLERLTVDLTDQRTSSQKEQQKLLALKAQLVDQKALADQKRREQTTLLGETKNRESNYTKLLADREARKKQAENEIANFEAQLRAEIDRGSFPSPGTKVLAYPLDDVFVTQKFGKTVDSVRLYVSGTHNGIDFRASPGTPVLAAGDGVILGRGDTDTACRGASYGRWVLIKHKNGLSTLYAHLDLIKVTTGQEVHIGDVIGYSGSTGYATGPHLHFALFVSSVLQVVDLPSKSCPKAVFHIPVAPLSGYLDPQAYL